MGQITAVEIEALYRPLMTIGCLGERPEAGYFRPSWSPEEEAAFDYIRTQAEKIGLTPRSDAVGNLFLEQSGYTEYVETGSHLDTVVKGGNFDGAAGVIAGLAAIESVLKLRLPQLRGLRLRIWRGEESAAFALGCKGSRAAFGKLPASTLQKTFRDKTLEESIEMLGFTPAPIREGKKTIDQTEIDGISAHLELHIEQANSLETRNIDIGVVTSIRGPSRWLLTLAGRFDHSGGTPMGVEYRRDANLALAYLIVELDGLCSAAIAQGKDLVQTFGVINSDSSLCGAYPQIQSNAVAKVSGFVCFSLDVRSNDGPFRSEYLQQAFLKAKDVADRFRVELHIEKISETEPNECLDEDLQDLQFESAKGLGYSVVRLPSGAVHDCLYVGEQKRTDGTQVPIGMLFIPCREGISHAPEEFASYEAIAQGANVLAEVMRKLVQEPKVRA